MLTSALKVGVGERSGSAVVPASAGRDAEVLFGLPFASQSRGYENTRTRFSSYTPRPRGIVFGPSRPHSFPIPRTVD